MIVINRAGIVYLPVHTVKVETGFLKIIITWRFE